MKIMKIVWVLAVLISSSFAEGRPKVTINNGEISGHYKTSFGGRKYAAFEGIPYAKPPVGDLRFEEAQPAEPWEGVWDATLLHECIQDGQAFGGPGISGDEDCLYISVYTPRETIDPTENLDVIVHIHGGAFMVGSGHQYTDAQIPMDHDVIFVSFNYRLGIMGFLSTEDYPAPGNIGLKDQALALKWVQENIANFGGNPKSVTITGLSAGGASVHFHLFSPLSAGLFHRAHSESGAVLNPWALQEKPLEKAKKLASLVGCEHDTSVNLIKCLKTRPAKQLLSKLPHFYGYKTTPLAPFAPMIEPVSKNSFLPRHPLALLAEKKTNDVPWLTCTTTDEGLLAAYFLPQDLDELNEKWPEIAPYILEYNYTLARSLWGSKANEMLEHYVGGKITKENFKKFIQISTDRLFANGAELAAIKQAKAHKSPVYYYLFNYASNTFNISPIPVDGVTHGASAVFNYGKPNKEIITETDREMIKVSTNMLISFVKTGVPVIEGVEWEPVTGPHLTFLNITSPTDIKLQTVEELTPRTFWRDLGILENENVVLIRDEL